MYYHSDVIFYHYYRHYHYHYYLGEGNTACFLHLLLLVCPLRLLHQRGRLLYPHVMKHVGTCFISVFVSHDLYVSVSCEGKLKFTLDLQALQWIIFLYLPIAYLN